MSAAPNTPDPLVDVLEVVPHLELTLTSSSMRPFAPKGARIVCRRPHPDEDVLHRVVLVRQGDRRLAHRAVRSWIDADGEQWLYTRGDSSAGSEKVRRADVIGVVDALYMGGVQVPLHRLPARVEGTIAWLARQVVVFPRRLRRARRRMLAA